MKKIFLCVGLFIFIIFSSERTSAQSGNHSDKVIFAQGIYLRNLGTFGQVWSQAAGGYLGYGIYFPEHNLLMFRTGFMSHTLRSEEQMNGSLSVVPLQIGGRYNFTSTTFIPYFQFMNGFNLIFENIDLAGEKKDRTLVRYFWEVGVGGTLSLTENLKLDLGINYNSAFYDNNKELYHASGAMMTGFEYSIGFGWLLN